MEFKISMIIYDAGQSPELVVLWFQSTGSSLLWISFMPHEK
jgi:hypothetical protein